MGFRRALLAGLGIALMAAGAALAGEQEVSIAGGKAPLYGTLLMPEGVQPVPAVLLLAGSGPTDRDGNSTMPGVKPATLKLIADGLAAHGIASLRTDKRGIAKSAAAMTSEADLRFDTYVDDAIAWAKFLKAQSRVGCLFILGHSEGAQIGALAAAKVPVCGFISVSGTGQMAGDVLLRQLQNSPPATYAVIEQDIAQLKQGKTVADVPPGLMMLFRPSVQPYLISWFAKDPVASLAAVKAPILVMQGTTDIQVRVEDARLLAAARPGITLVLLDGTNHVLKTAPADRATNFATYADPALPLAPGVMPALTAFIARNAQS
jgi:pimeloyl-ACP methyl ester carboxylesterase